jgi:hypothetical protein
MAIAAGLNRYACSRLMPEILGHHGGSAAKERKWIGQHPFVADGDQSGHPRTIGFGKDGGRIAIRRSAQLGVFLRRRLPRP